MSASGARHALTPRSAIFLVIANMIGAGVFTTSGYALADHSRGVVMIAWCVGGVIAVTGALCYGALGRRFPRSGGEYELLRSTISPFAGFIAGWISLFAGFSAPIAIAAATCEKYLDAAFGIGAPAHLIGAIAIVVAGSLHAAGLRVGARAQDALVSFKLVFITLLVTLGAIALAARGEVVPAEVVAPVSGLGAFAVTCVWVSFSYTGWNAASYVAGEVDVSRRSLTRILVAGTLITTAAYLALNAVFVFSAPRSELAGKGEIGVLAARALSGEGAAQALAALVAIASVTSITAMTMAGPRVYARMAEDGYLPRAVATVGGHRAAIALQVVLALVFLWWKDLSELVGFAGWTLALCSAAAIIGLVRTRWREGPGAVPVPGWPLVPAIYLVATLGIGGFAFAYQPEQGLLGLGVAASGAVVWMILRLAKR